MPGCGLQVGCRCDALGDVAASVTYTYASANFGTRISPLDVEGPLGLGVTGLPHFVGGLLLLIILLALQGLFLWTVWQRQIGEKVTHVSATGQTNHLRELARRLLALPGIADLHSAHGASGGKTGAASNKQQPSGKQGNAAASAAARRSRTIRDAEEVRSWFSDMTKPWLPRAVREFIITNEYATLFRAIVNRNGRDAGVVHDEMISMSPRYVGHVQTAPGVALQECLAGGLGLTPMSHF